MGTLLATAPSVAAIATTGCAPASVVTQLTESLAAVTWQSVGKPAATRLMEVPGTQALPLTGIEVAPRGNVTRGRPTSIVGVCTMASAAEAWIPPLGVCATTSAVVPARGRIPHTPCGSMNMGAVKVPVKVAVACTRRSKAVTEPSVWTKCSMPIVMGTPLGQPVPYTTIWLPATALAVLRKIRAPVASAGTDAEARRPVAADAPHERGRVRVDAAACTCAAAPTSSTQRVVARMATVARVAKAATERSQNSLVAWAWPMWLTKTVRGGGISDIGSLLGQQRVKQRDPIIALRARGRLDVAMASRGRAEGRWEVAWSRQKVYRRRSRW